MAISNGSFSGKKVFVGVDVHKKTYALYVIIGESIRRLTMPADPVGLTRWLKQTYRGACIRSAYEAGFAGFTLHRALEEGGITNLVVNPASIPVAANDRVKTDKRDAKKLAELLTAGKLRGIHVPSLKQELARLLPRTRIQLVREKTRLGNQVKAKLMEFGFFEADDDRPMSLSLLKEIESMNLPEELRFAIKALAATFRATHMQVVELERKLKDQAVKDQAVDAVYRSVPGVGPISSRVFANELGDMKRFPNQRALSSYTGLTPSEHSSGERTRRGGITHQGNSYLRYCLIEAAWRAIREDVELKRRYERLKLRCGGKKAIVAIARLLCIRMRACLLSEQPYQLAKAS